MRRVLIGTPSYNWQVDVRYTHALTQTVRMGLQRAIDVREMFPVGKLVEDARNELIQLAVEYDFDDLVFIDADQDWQAEDFFRLLAHPVDVVGVPVRKKTEVDEAYNVRAPGGPESLLHDPSTGLWTSPDMSVGTGMLRLSRIAIAALWNSGEEYVIRGNPTRYRWIFEVKPHNGELVSEDIRVAWRLRSLGFETWIDPTIKVSHFGLKAYTGDFLEWLGKFFQDEKMRA